MLTHRAESHTGTKLDSASFQKKNGSSSQPLGSLYLLLA